tara:strand:- start:21830 stop:22429 length:600 start_codon:yes stop_codon:yes gene_type:complete
MITNSNYILASSSKSRFSILKNAGISFKQVKPLCNEEKIKKKLFKEKFSPSKIAKTLSYEKAKSISKTKKYYTKNVIGCDTIIYLNKEIFNKANSLLEAKRKLKVLSGRKHKIITGLTICKEGKKVWQCSATTEVKIRNLKTKEIDGYLKKTGKQIINSVGCYQIEALGPSIIEKINGDFFNVMGLPLFKLLKYTHSHR